MMMELLSTESRVSYMPPAKVTMHRAIKKSILSPAFRRCRGVLPRR